MRYPYPLFFACSTCSDVPPSRKPLIYKVSGSRADWNTDSVPPCSAMFRCSALAPLDGATGIACSPRLPWPAAGSAGSNWMHAASGQPLAPTRQNVQQPEPNSRNSERPTTAFDCRPMIAPAVRGTCTSPPGIDCRLANQHRAPRSRLKRRAARRRPGCCATGGGSKSLSTEPAGNRVPSHVRKMSALTNLVTRCGYVTDSSWGTCEAAVDLRNAETRQKSGIRCGKPLPLPAGPCLRSKVASSGKAPREAACQ